MVDLPHYVRTVLRHCMVAVILLILTAQCHSSAIVERLQTQAATSANKQVTENRATKTPGWWPIVECVFLTDVSKCLQDRTVRAIVGLDRKDDIQINTEKGTVKLPGEPEEGIFEVIGDLMSDGISRLFQDDDDEDKKEVADDDEDEEGAVSSENGDSNSLGSASSRTNLIAENANTDVETGRGKKKKKKKQKKKAIIKLILLILLIKLKIAKLLYVFGKLMEFKFVTFVGINTLINLVRLFYEWKKKKESEKVVVSYEQAHHQHHYDEHHHVDPYSYDNGHENEDKGWLNGLWSRSGSLEGGRDHAHDIAYYAQKPSLNKDSSSLGGVYYGTSSVQNPTYPTQKKLQ